MKSINCKYCDETDTWYADGQVHGEDYELASFLGSKMSQRGVICLDCHNPHSAKTILPGNNLCLRCHNGSVSNAPVIQPEQHSHHGLTSAGNQCFACHMPVTVYMQRHARHDHGFTIPDPLLTKELGIPNACISLPAKEEGTDWAIAATAQKWADGAKNGAPHAGTGALGGRAGQKGEDTAKIKYQMEILEPKRESYLLAGGGGRPVVALAGRRRASRPRSRLRSRTIIPWCARGRSVRLNRRRTPAMTP